MSSITKHPLPHPSSDKKNKNRRLFLRRSPANCPPPGVSSYLSDMVAMTTAFTDTTRVTLYRAGGRLVQWNMRATCRSGKVFHFIPGPALSSLSKQPGRLALSSHNIQLAKTFHIVSRKEIPSSLPSFNEAVNWELFEYWVFSTSQSCDRF